MGDFGCKLPKHRLPRLLLAGADPNALSQNGKILTRLLEEERVSTGEGT